MREVYPDVNWYEHLFLQLSVQRGEDLERMADKFATTIESLDKFKQDVLYANFVLPKVYFVVVTSSALI